MIPILKSAARQLNCFNKVLQYLKPHVTALLRMELAGEHIVLFHGGMDMCPVLGGRFDNTLIP